MTAAAAQIDRRAFIAASSLTFAAASAQGFSLPLVLPSAHAVPIPVPLDDWTIDDMWTGYPRPSQAIACGRAGDDGLSNPTAATMAPGSIEALFA